MSSFPDPVGALTLFSILSDGSADICFWQGQGSGQGPGTGQEKEPVEK